MWPEDESILKNIKKSSVAGAKCVGTKVMGDENPRDTGRPEHVWLYKPS